MIFNKWSTLIYLLLSLNNQYLIVIKNNYNEKYIIIFKIIIYFKNNI